MPTIGERLRAAREAKGLQVGDAHRQTKIHARILQAMEEDRTGEVLEPAYAKGFLKKYAAFLNLDPAPLVEEYLRTEQAAAPAPTRATAEGNGSPSSGTAPSPVLRWLGPAALVLIAIVGVVFMVALAKDLSHTITASSLPAAAPAPKSATPSAPPPPKLLIPKSQPLKLTIKAAQDCWMQVKADGKVLFQNVLGKGREETWTASDAIELWVGNAAALTLTLNGRPLEPLGLGVIRGIRVTHYGVQAPKKSRSAP